MKEGGMHTLPQVEVEIQEAFLGNHVGTCGLYKAVVFKLCSNEPLQRLVGKGVRRPDIEVFRQGSAAGLLERLI